MGTMSSRKNKSNRKRKSKRSHIVASIPSEDTPDPKYLKPCKQLLNQITGIDDSKPFQKAMTSSNKLFSEYQRLIPNALSFKSIHARLYAQPCEYHEFNADIKRIFLQQKRLKNVRGSEQEAAKKRMQKAKRVENYWSSLTAPYTQYGFDAVISYKNKDSDSDESEKEEKKLRKRQKNKESKKQKQHQMVLSNIKKRVKRDQSMESMASPNKRRRLNNNNTERILRSNKNESDIFDDDDDSKKQLEDDEDTPQRPRYSAKRRTNVGDEDDDVMIIREEREETLSNLDVDSEANDIYGTVKDSPFTPFADKSRVFGQMMGNTEDLFKNLQHPMSDPSSKLVKKRLNFVGYDDNDNNHNHKMDQILYQRPPMNTFRIKWRYDDGFHNEEARFVDIEAVRMDRAVQEFMENHSHSTVKLMSVKMTLLG